MGVLGARSGVAVMFFSSLLQVEFSSERPSDTGMNGVFRLENRSMQPQHG
jgi:hypothetical protein